MITPRPVEKRGKGGPTRPGLHSSALSGWRDTVYSWIGDVHLFPDERDAGSCRVQTTPAAGQGSRIRHSQRR